MISASTPTWQPTKVRRTQECLNTGTEVVALVTDAGQGFAKFLGNKEGPHVLACEFIGTKLAQMLGLPVFDHTLFAYDGIPEILLASGRRAEIGLAWITRREEGIRWSGLAEDLSDLENRRDLAALVLLDLWTLNCDRYRPDPLRVNHGNVFLSREGAAEGRLRLVAMDHTHILTCGRPLTPRVAHIDRVQDAQRYGLFPAFQSIITWAEAVAARERLAAIDMAAVRALVASVPEEWSLDDPSRTAISQFLDQRRDWLLGTFPRSIIDQPEFFLPPPTP